MSYNRKLNAAARLVLAASAWIVIAGAAPQGADLNGIRASIESMRDAVRRGDAPRLTGFYTPDAQLITADRTIQGAEAIRAYSTAVLGILGDFRNEEQEIFPGDGVAVETGRAQFFDKSGGLLSTSRYMTVWKRGADGQWRIHRDIGVPITRGNSVPPNAGQLFSVKTEPARYAVVLPMTGSHSQHNDAIGKLVGYLVEQHSPPQGSAFGRYFNSPADTPEANLRWEVGFFVAARPASVAAPFEVRDFPAGNIASVVVGGPQKPWTEFTGWLVNAGYVPTGPAMEIWLDGSRTELRIAVEKPAR